MTTEPSAIIPPFYTDFRKKGQEMILIFVKESSMEGENKEYWNKKTRWNPSGFKRLS